MRSTMAAVLLCALLPMPVASAEPPISVRLEVSFLLGYVEGSGCGFNRNGIWYDARAAQAHLRDKYDYLVAADLVNTTEDFIDRAATASSMSGQAYEVRCNGGATMASSRWLREELARHRMSR